MTSLALQALQLSCYRDDRLLFTDFSFSLSAGEGLLIAGANGAGKSTLLRILAGLFTPTDGQVQWCQHDISELADQYRNNLAYLGHKTGIKLGLTVQENLHIAGVLQKKQEIAEQLLLEEFNLHDLKDIPAQKLSAGQKQRLALVSLLQSSAKLWLLDEPLTALDSGAITTLQFYLQRHLERGGMLVMASHQPLLLKNMARVDL